MRHNFSCISMDIIYIYNSVISHTTPAGEAVLVSCPASRHRTSMTNANPGTPAYVVSSRKPLKVNLVVPSPVIEQFSARLERPLSSRVRTERLRAWPPNVFCKSCTSDEYCQSSGYIRTEVKGKVSLKSWKLSLGSNNDPKKDSV